MRILPDHNVPVGLRSFLSNHEVRTIVEMGWSPQLENGELLNEAEAAGFNVLLTSEQNIPSQQDLKNRKIALVILGSNIWAIVRKHASEIATRIPVAKSGSFEFIEMRIPTKSTKR